MHTFCFISKKSQILKEFRNNEKLAIFRKKDDFTEVLHAYVCNVGLNRNSWKKKRKKTGFNEKPHFLGV